MADEKQSLYPLYIMAIVGIVAIVVLVIVSLNYSNANVTYGAATPATLTGNLRAVSATDSGSSNSGGGTYPVRPMQCYQSGADVANNVWHCTYT